VRVVLDTNTLISGIISSGGPPRRLFNGMRSQVFETFSSATLLAELLDVLLRDKFIARLTAAGLTPQEIVADVRRLAILVEPTDVPAVIAADPDDDHVLACAVIAGAELIVSGDSHLLGLGSYQRIRIVAPAEAVAILWPD
jgi:putative PIN family toxin of toxin-antitoxin system